MSYLYFIYNLIFIIGNKSCLFNQEKVKVESHKGEEVNNDNLDIFVINKKVLEQR